MDKGSGRGNYLKSVKNILKKGPLEFLDGPFWGEKRKAKKNRRVLSRIFSSRTEAETQS